MNKEISEEFKKKLIEGYKKNAKRDLKMLKEWENVSNEVTWEY